MSFRTVIERLLQLIPVLFGVAASASGGQDRKQEQQQQRYSASCR